MYHDGRPLEIMDWKRFVSDLHDAAESILCQLMFLKEGQLPHVDLYKIYDNPNIHDVKP